MHCGRCGCGSDDADSTKVLKNHLPNVFLVVYFVLLLTSMLLISVDEFDFSTNFTSVVTVLNNMGPGLNLVGPTQNFSIFSPFSKFVLMFDMLAGRLELFPMMILLMPSTWKRK